MKESYAWEDRVKKGLFKEQLFSKDMKMSVMEAVERRPMLAWTRWMKMAGAALACMIAAIILLSWQGDAKQALTEGASASAFEIPLVYKALDARTHKQGQTINEGDPNILPGLSNKYSPIENSGYIDQIPFSDIELTDKKDIPGFGTALLYEFKDRSQRIPRSDGRTDYLGFEIEGLSGPGMLFNFGFGHLYEEELSATRLFGIDVLKIAPQKCRIDGDACVWYLKRDTNGVSTYASFAAATFERDLDGDGKEEAIVATYKENQIYIFREENGELLWVSLREALSADKQDDLYYDGNLGTFEWRRAGEGGLVQKYRYAEGEDKLVRLSE